MTHPGADREPAGGDRARRHELVPGAGDGTREDGGPRVPARVARGTRGAVVAPHHLATAAGLGILASGGSAVDAAIATNAVLAVVMPNGCGIGGDAFWLVWDERGGEQVALNGSGRAPALVDAASLRSRGLERLPLRGPLGITIPGAVRSWGDAHRRWGRLTAAQVLEPAIQLAGEGFAAWEGFMEAVERTAASLPAAAWAAGFSAVYRPHGPWRPGARVRLPALAETLGRLAVDGFDAFYDGDLAEQQVAALQAAGAPVALPDLRDHRSTWTVPLATTYRGVRVTTHPPNSAGFVALRSLNVLECFEPPAAAAFGASGWRDARWLHLALEVAKRTLAERDSHLADPATREIPLGRLLDKRDAAVLAASIDPSRADAAPPPVRTLVGGTIYLGVVDGEGNAVSLIQSNAAGFGSGVVDPATGIHYQNRGASFSLEPGHPNLLAPGRRTAHTLMPGMLFREGERRPWIVAGAMGGDLQPQIHVQAVSALVDGDADLAAVVSAPRCVVEPVGFMAPPLHVVAEPRFGPGVLEALEAMGHRVSRTTPFDSGMGHGHAIELVAGGPAAGGSLGAATDPRSAGRPAVR
jgi:gamma-glutamyltranspeptidase